MHRTLKYGGIFMYPATTKSRSGKVRNALQYIQYLHSRRLNTTCIAHGSLKRNSQYFVDVVFTGVCIFTILLYYKHSNLSK